jgi:hypothetical protein
MKRLVMVVWCVALAGSALAQTAFGVLAGPEFSSLTSKMNGAKTTTHMLAGVAAGAYVRLPLAHAFSVQPSLLYEGKGGSQQQSGYKVKTRLNYLTLPVDFLYMPVSAGPSSGQWMVGLGPYLAYGLSGKISGGPSLVDVSGDPFRDGAGAQKRFDAGADVMAGYSFDTGFSVSLHADLGVLNLAHEGNSQNGLRNTAFKVLLGYRVGTSR